MFHVPGEFPSSQDTDMAGFEESLLTSHGRKVDDFHEGSDYGSTPKAKRHGSSSLVLLSSSPPREQDDNSQR